MWPNSNKQLCSDTNALAERMRNFNRERQLQLNEAENQFNTKLDAAKTEEEKVKIGQQKNEFFDQWLDRSDYDWDNIFLPKVQDLRKEIISRLAIQSKDQKDQLMGDDVLFDGRQGVVHSKILQTRLIVGRANFAHGQYFIGATCGASVSA